MINKMEQGEDVLGQKGHVVLYKLVIIIMVTGKQSREKQFSQNQI